MAVGIRCVGIFFFFIEVRIEHKCMFVFFVWIKNYLQHESIQQQKSLHDTSIKKREHTE